MRRALMILLLAVLCAACVPQLEDEDTPRHFDTDTVMGVIQERGELVVAIDPGAPPFSYMDGDEAKGFIVDLAGELATALGVKARFVSSPSSGMLIPLEAGSVDVVFPLEAVTERLAKKYGVTDPYYVAHERFLAARRAEIHDIAQGPVCSLSDPETEADLTEVLPGTSETQDATLDFCAAGLRQQGVVGVLGADPLLMAVWTLAAECAAPCGGEFRITGDQYSTEGYSAIVASGVSGWQGYINNVFDETKAEGRWTEYYDKWVRPYVLHATEPPDMTAEEAAALFPRDLEGP